MKKRNNNIILFILSFFLPSLILAAVYALKGIYPGGENTVLFYDLRSQYISFYAYLKHMGEGFNNILYQSLSGLGGGYYGNFFYYTGNPLSFIVCFFSEEHLPYAIWLITLIKIGLCGLTFCDFLLYGHLKESRIIAVVLFSSSYALTSFVITNSLNLMFLDGVIMLPLVVLGVDRILEGEKGLLLGVTVCLSVIFNYYTAFMVMIFAVIWFLYRFFSEKRQVSGKAVYFRCLLAGVFGVLCSTFVWLPVLKDFSRGRLHENVMHDTSLILRNPFSIIRNMLPLSFGGYLNDDAPALFFGTVSFVLAFSFFVSNKVPLKKKIASFTVIVIFWISFVFRVPDTVWTAFSVANGYPARYAFMYSFFMIYLAAFMLSKLDLSLRHLHLFSLPILVFAEAELFINASYLTGAITNETDPYSDAQEYLKALDTVEAMEDGTENDFWVQSGKFWRYTENDGLMYGSPALSYYSSSYNFGLHEFLGELGLEEHYHHFTDKGLTPFTEKLLGIGNICRYSSDEPGEDYIYYGAYDVCSFYADEKIVPFAFLIGAGMPGTDNGSSNPFQIQNDIASELAGEYCEVFTDISTDISELSYDEQSGLYWRSVSLNLDEETDIYLYIDSTEMYRPDGTGFEPAIYYNGSPISAYRSVLSSYCVHLGTGSGKIEFDIVSPVEIGDVYFAAYNKTAVERVMDQLLARSDMKAAADDSGVEISLSAKEAGDLVIKMPYEAGYSILVDGAETEYHAYRNAFISIPVNDGEHNIRIRYFTPLLKEGIIVSIISAMIGMLVMILYHRKHFTSEKIR